MTTVDLSADPSADLPAPPVTTAGRIRWALHDGVTVVRRNLAQLKAQPGELIGALIFPAIMVVLFGYVFGSAIAVPGGGNYREYLMPGLFAMTTVTGVLPTLLGMATDAGKGIMDRFRSMPIARSAVPFGQTGADILTGVLAMTIMVGCGFVVGWRPHNGIAMTLAAFGLLVLMRYAVSWAGAYLGLLIGDPETADQYVPLVFPVTMVSNTFVPTTHMPAWLRAIAEWNPVSALVAACRHLFGNPGAPAGHGPWPLAHPVAATLAWSLVLLAVFVPLTVRRYVTMSR
jgi:ABC-2 type transport system permease protein